MFVTVAQLAAAMHPFGTLGCCHKMDGMALGHKV